jgi:cobalt-zinc-cadmium efflux system membrane fusion protein
MNREARVQLQWPVAVAAAAALVAAGALATYVLVRPGSQPRAQVPSPTPASSSQSSQMLRNATVGPLPDVIIALTEEAIKRAGIVSATVESRPMVSMLRLPAVVEANAYKQVTVTPLLSGRITRVLVDLGAHVRQGQSMATVFSPELAEAQTRFIGASAEFEAHERELARTEKLVQIGSASRQELERIHAEHTAQRTTVQSARSRLELLGMSDKAIDGLTTGKSVIANTDVPAPIAGVVTERLGNPGLNVDPSAKLFTVVDLSTVWIVANLYEKDFSRVRVGDRAAIVSSAYPDVTLKGSVGYIDPQVSPQTRTAKLRIEVPNPRQELRLGMLAEVQVEAADQTPATVVPKSAVQTIADRSFVYLPKRDAPTQFVEREVRLGAPSGDRIQVLSGLTPGEQVVADGSFFLRAERDRIGSRPGSPDVAGAMRAEAPRSSAAPTSSQTMKILVTEQGFEPARVNVRSGALARLTFVRTTEKTCGTEVVFPSLNIKRALRLNEPVVIEFTPSKSGDLAFACGMNMLKGVVVVD